jgi:hypothetical protein
MAGTIKVHLKQYYEYVLSRSCLRKKSPWVSFCIFVLLITTSENKLDSDCPWKKYTRQHSLRRHCLKLQYCTSKTPLSVFLELFLNLRVDYMVLQRRENPTQIAQIEGGNGGEMIVCALACKVSRHFCTGIHVIPLTERAGRVFNAC